MKSGIDCRGNEWEERSLSGKMINISGLRFGRLVSMFPVMSNNSEKVVRLIEFDGKQHEKPYDFFGGEEKFLKVQKNDTLKNQYALDHNIPLVRIPYKKRDSMTLDDLLGSEYVYN